MFSGEYPHIEEAEEFVSYITTRENGISKLLKEGVMDKSIRDDMDANLTACTISNIMLAISQRIVIRGEHLKIEQGFSNEMLTHSVTLMLEGIKAR